MLLRHVLCAVDFSAVTERAFAEALRVATATKSRLTLLHAVPLDETFNAAARERRIRLGALRDEARRRGVPARVVVQQGAAAGIILLHARTRAVDLLVLGTHHRSGLARLRPGSVAESVAQQAPCPTLVVPERSTDQRGAVLCAIDLGHMASRTIQAALAAAGTIVDSTQVEFLHVTRRVPSTLPRHGWWLADPAYRRSEQRALTRQLQALIPSGDTPRGEARVVAGRAASAIVSAGVTMRAALIVVGMTRRGPLGRRLRRSTAVTVMRESPCPVLVVPPRLAAAAARLRPAA